MPTFNSSKLYRILPYSCFEELKRSIQELSSSVVKGIVDEKSDLPLTGNIIGSIYWVLHDPDMSTTNGALYQCIATSGDVDTQWEKKITIDYNFSNVDGPGVSGNVVNDTLYIYIDETYWAKKSYVDLVASNKVSKTGDETINGIKTFNEYPQIDSYITQSNPLEFATVKYVMDHVGIQNINVQDDGVSVGSSSTLNFKGDMVASNAGNRINILFTHGDVTSVNGMHGDVLLDTDNIAEAVDNLYFTVSRVLSIPQIESAINNSHKHTNKSELDHISDGWHDSKIGNIHSMISNDIPDLQNAITNNTTVSLNASNRHTHSNINQLDLITDGLHSTRTNNPHSVTASQVINLNEYISSNVSDVISNTEARHTHDNKGLLDSYTISNTQISYTYGVAHSHVNKSQLDLITDGLHSTRTNNPHSVTLSQLNGIDSYINNNDNVLSNTNARHTHNNKSQIDLITDGLHSTRTNNPHSVSASQVINLDSYITNISEIQIISALTHSHSNLALLDTYTNTNNNITDAVNKRHTHTNKSQLDLITDGLHSTRTNNPHSVTASQIIGIDNYINSNINVLSNTNARHTHTNKSQLDLITDGLHSTRTGNVHSIVSSDIGAIPLTQKSAINGVATLDSNGTIPLNQLPSNIVGPLVYQATWDASTNTYPTNPNKGQYWVIDTSGIISSVEYNVNDWITYNGNSWDKVDNSESVTSVNGKVGNVVLTTTDIAEGDNLYFTVSRVLSIPQVSSAIQNTHTHINKNLLDSYTNSNTLITDAISKRHTHSNINQLDLITDGLHSTRINNPHSVTASQVIGIDNYINSNINVLSNTQARHTHSNKSQLDLITDGLHSTRINNPHSVTASQVIGIDNYIESNAKFIIISQLAHNHLNKNLLDSYTISNTQISHTLELAHSHTNKSQLDLITDGLHSTRTGNVHSITASQLIGIDNYINSNINVLSNTNARHIHNNKSQIDLITDGLHSTRTNNPHSVTASQVINLDSYITNISNIQYIISLTHSHSNLSLLETYTFSNSEVISNTQARHTHNNKSQIDLITDGLHSTRIGNVHSIIASNISDFQIAVSNNNYVHNNTLHRLMTNDNPHGITPSMINAIPMAQKSAIGGIASLDSNGTVPLSQLPDTIIGGMEYKGTWDCSTGSYPSSPENGDYYVCNVAGTISGIDYESGDWLAYNGTIWNKIDNTEAVQRVNSMVGDITLTTDNIGEGITNEYYTDIKVCSNACVISNTIHRSNTNNPHSITASQIGAIGGIQIELNDSIVSSYVTTLNFEGGSVESIIKEATKTTIKFADIYEKSFSTIGGSVSITSSGKVGICVQSNHGYLTNQKIIITGTTNYNGNYGITVVDSDTYKIALDSTFNNSTAQIGTVTVVDPWNGVDPVSLRDAIDRLLLALSYHADINIE